MHIIMIQAPEQKREIASQILQDLPEWFGIQESTAEYIRESASMPFWATFRESQPAGFICLKENTPYSAEIYVMGVRKEFHHLGIGKSLFHTLLIWSIEQGYEYLQVKTLDASHPDPNYDKTRKFYQAMGFVPLECLPSLWGEGCPCLIMVQKIQKTN